MDVLWIALARHKQAMFVEHSIAALHASDQLVKPAILHPAAALALRKQLTLIECGEYPTMESTAIAASRCCQFNPTEHLSPRSASGRSHHSSILQMTWLNSVQLLITSPGFNDINHWRCRRSQSSSPAYFLPRRFGSPRQIGGLLRNGGSGGK